MTTPATSLGAFSISLAVKDLAASRDFYRKLGFEPVGGNPSQNWLVLRNGSATIGLFCGMFERNLLTFNPGWDAQCAALEQFTDVRELQRRLEASGVTPVKRADDGGSGPDSFVVVDPDGNPVLVDQHV
ncbi:MAG: VOC family protein [Deltaproteobacteria bacterium]|nr:VOC family protein [Deltaproteobacteria bacterium]